jgi:hypothetical protein
MKQKIIITIDQELLSFIDRQAQGNRSEYLNSLLIEERRKSLKAQLPYCKKMSKILNIWRKLLNGMEWPEMGLMTNGHYSIQWRNRSPSPRYSFLQPLVAPQYRSECD